MTLKDTFRKGSSWTWARLREGRACDYKVGEESLTDMLLLRLRKEAPSHITVSPFTKRQEGTTGADWEWWFTDSSGRWLGMLIQAKVLNHKTDRFEYLHYQSQGKKQKTKLKQYAQRKNMIPAYCLYSNWSHHRNLKRSLCNCFDHQVAHFGASLAPISAIEKLGSQAGNSQGPRNHLFNVLGSLMPLQCLFCNAIFSTHPSSSYDTENLEALVRALESRSFFDSTNLSLDTILREAPPRYVSLIQEGNMPDSNDETDELEDNKELDLPDENIRHVVVFDVGERTEEIGDQEKRDASSNSDFGSNAV